MSKHLTVVADKAAPTQSLGEEIETIEALEERARRMGQDMVAQFHDRLKVMIGDAKRLAELNTVPVGVREEMRQIGVAMTKGDERLVVLRGRG